MIVAGKKRGTVRKNDFSGKNSVLPRIIADHLGSIRVTLDQNGNIDSWTDYYPFGKEARSSATANRPKEMFTGKERDSEIGLDYFGARYYNPDIVRWTSVDPLWEKHPDWTPYNYVLGNPIRLIDPDGRQVEAIAIFGYGAGAAGGTGGGALLPAALSNPIGWVALAGAALYVAGQEMNKSAWEYEASKGPIVQSEGIPIETALQDQTLVNTPTGDLGTSTLVNIPGDGVGGVTITDTPLDQGMQSTTTESIKTANGIELKGFTGHGVDQAINRGVKPGPMLDALKNPLKINEVVHDAQGRPSQRLIGQKAEVAINPSTGKIVSANPTSTKKAERLKKDNESEK